MELAILGRCSGRSATMALATPFIGITDDCQTAYVQVQKGGTVGIYRVALSGDEAWDVVVGGERNCVLLDMKDDTLLFSSDDIINPEDLYTAKVDGSDEAQLTQLNADLLADIIQPEFLNLHFKGVDGGGC